VGEDRGGRERLTFRCGWWTSDEGESEADDDEAAPAALPENKAEKELKKTT
jgi:hypothetical protein